ncbi:MAG: hypothetical protein EOO45_12465 [Flavobacterium sp.]|nr:MAG: hypothetical protein EOO45_12465 [Flavobacterium sp.]
MKSILSLFFLISVLVAHAQGVPDMFFNKQHTFDNFVLKLNADKTYLRGKMEFTCNIFRGEKSSAMVRLDSAIVRACRLPVENETEYAILLREANLRLDVMNELNASSRSYRGGNVSNPRLTSVEGDIASVSAGRVLYEVKYGFEFSNPESREGKEKLYVRRYYLGNIATGSFSAWRPVINERTKKAIEALVRKQFNDQYLTGKKKLSRQELDDYNNYEEDNTEATPANPAGDVLERVNLSRADCYWYNGGLMIQFQEYTDGSKIFEGRHFRIFFTHDVALKIAALIPEFNYITALPRLKNSYRGWNDAAMYEKFTILRTEPSSLDFAKKISERKVKSLTVINNYLPKAGNPTFQGKNEYEFDAAGRLLSTISYNEGNAVHSIIINDYNSKGAISRSITQNKNKNTVASVYYEYDTFGNILERTSIQDNTTDVTYFFYNGDYVYQFSAPVFGEGQSYNWITQITNTTLCSNNTCYELDKKGQIVAVTAAQYSSSRIQIGRDNDGRLVEVHADNDRYHYYLDYNSSGFIKRFGHYEYMNIKKEVTYEYHNESPFPYRITRDNGDNIIEELLTWQFF